MKRMILVLLAGFALSVKAQDASVEKSVTGLQTGLLGVWLNNEFRIAKPIALRTEIGLDASNTGYTKFTQRATLGFTAVPVISIEPRYYFNLKRRVDKAKSIEGNSGNFVSLNFMVHPNWFVIPSKKTEGVTGSGFLTPMFGIRRNLGKHFNYEVAVGLGYGLVKDYETIPFVLSPRYSTVFIIQNPIKIGYKF